MLLARLAFRNIFRHRRRSLLTGMMMAGGCALFSFFIGIADGSYDNVITLFTGDHTGHVQVHRKGYLDRPSLERRIRDSHVLEKILAVKGVRAAAQRIHAPALAFADTKTTGVVVTGIDLNREPGVTTIRSKIKQGEFLSRPDAPEVIISSRLSKVLGVGLGGEVALISQAADGSIANGLFTIAGIINSDGGSYDSSRIYMAIEKADEFFVLSGGMHEIAVMLDTHRHSRQGAASINAALGGSTDNDLVASPWETVEEEFYKAMLVDLKGDRIAMGVFTVIIALGVLNTVLMVVLERTREYGVMRALGTRPGVIFTLIVLESVMLALISAAVGSVAGAALNHLIALKGIAMPAPIEFGGVVFERLTSRISVGSLLYPALVILATAIAVSIPPAMRAARISPVRALRG